ncbi:hypothetical protein [Nocardiopsis aegyptia]|uniref:Uncharacterized protein n=1 Tax=Nocardiopsis aegyptia TaxID=220378 RepID=A0A7Z0ELB7_9ACTN|nr:hypothetical protein [Nocardiopsis aegyptia]NYJ33726.1 hypothetical protein [Nocardiopsis aegyptia]
MTGPALVAAAWSTVSALLGLYWARGGAGFPFGEGDPEPALSWFGRATAEVGGPVIAMAAGAAAVIGLVMALPLRSAVARRFLAAAGWALAVVLLVIVPDYRVLMGVVYAPVLAVGWPLGLVATESVAGVYSWTVLSQIWCMAGGYAWAMAALGQGRRAGGACTVCGRTADEAGWTSRESAAAWGRTAVFVSVLMPLAYCVTRWAWALGISLGDPSSMVAEMGPGVRLAAAFLATSGLGGAVLTFGLIRPWGEVFPRWMVGLAGRRVPIMLAVIPAALVSVLFVNAGLMYIRLFLPQVIAEPAAWGAAAPEFLFPVWGGALAVATLAYYLRRRGGCADCGRGGEANGV